MLRLFGLGRAPKPVELGPVESPCRDLCGLNDDNTHCLGCFRTPREIAGWRQFSPKEQREIVDQLPARRAAHGG
jgi:predicted Fe-S protein YdhL (DUF1289 family)